jgi:phosphoribosylformylglycinamidine synthase subunit PurL
VEILDLNIETQKNLKKYRLRQSEYDLMKKLLKREPQGIEWALFSALWSEHCSYKSSKVHLKKFKWNHPRVLTSEGENAGVVDLGDGERIAFKMESHNHPSFIEPFHGAATGVGGILRDIFTMGARPIAIGDFLCFGEAEAPRMKTLMKQVVKGISYYGNCVGVPTVTGATYSMPEYNQNILVNAFALGLFEKKDQTVTVSGAQGVGNFVVYVGAKTGSDGVHGASMASEAFSEDMESKRPTVQIGDPFYEKLLIEACLEILDQNLVVAMQDMGAAGLTSSSFEMASKGKVGLKIHLDHVPLRDSRLGPEEILLSESQERMLLICEPAKMAAISQVFAKWGLESTKIGEVVEGHELELLWKNETLTKIDPDLLVENAPVYQRPYTKLGIKNIIDFPNKDKPVDSKKWIYRQYDQRVGLRTMREAGHPVALIRLNSGRAISIALGCRPWLMKQDPVMGAYDTVFEPAIKMLCAGAWPVAVTDCLNFGNPEKPEIMSEFVASVEAIAHAAKLWDAPVISGNVSFYNETEGQSIPSTPATGVVGLKAKRSPVVSDVITQENLTVALVGLDEPQNFNPEETLKSAKSLFSFIEKGQVLSARLVTEKGVNCSLELMKQENFECPVSSTFLDFKCLYKVILVYESKFAEEFKNCFKNFSELGTTKKMKSPYDLSPQINVFKKTWGIS